MRDSPRPVAAAGQAAKSEASKRKSQPTLSGLPLPTIRESLATTGGVGVRQLRLSSAAKQLNGLMGRPWRPLSRRTDNAQRARQIAADWRIASQSERLVPSRVVSVGGVPKWEDREAGTELLWLLLLAGAVVDQTLGGTSAPRPFSTLLWSSSTTPLLLTAQQSPRRRRPPTQCRISPAPGLSPLMSAQISTPGPRRYEAAAR